MSLKKKRHGLQLGGESCASVAKGVVLHSVVSSLIKMWSSNMRERKREMQSEAKISKRSVMASVATHSKMSQARYFQGMNNSSNNNS